MSQLTKNKTGLTQVKPDQPDYSKTYKQSQKNRVWLGVGGAIAIVAVVALILVISGDGQARGQLTASSTSFDFGTVKMNNGLLKTSFQLTADTPTVVTKLTSTWTCTKARLVQAEKTSDWLGMSHEGPAKDLNMELAAGQPVTLEVTVDPAAHGEAGLGSLQRGVMLETAAGQQLTFNLTGVVTR